MTFYKRLWTSSSSNCNSRIRSELSQCRKLRTFPFFKIRNITLITTAHGTSWSKSQDSDPVHIPVKESLYGALCAMLLMMLDIYSSVHTSFPHGSSQAKFTFTFPLDSRPVTFKVQPDTHLLREQYMGVSISDSTLASICYNNLHVQILYTNILSQRTRAWGMHTVHECMTLEG